MRENIGQGARPMGMQCVKHVVVSSAAGICDMFSHKSLVHVILIAAKR